MSEISLVFEKSSKQLRSLAKSLKNDNDLQNKMLKHLVDVPRWKDTAISKTNRKFKKHPTALSSGTDIAEEPLRNGYMKSHHYYDSHKHCDFNETLRRASSSDNLSQCINDGFSPNRSSVARSSSSGVILQVKKENKKHDPQRQNSENKIDFKSSDNSRPKFDNKMKPKQKPRKAFTIPSSAVNGYVDVENKLLLHLPKIISYMNDINKLLDERLPLPDGEADWVRKRTRAAEFVKALCRKYLYDLYRQVNLLQELTNNLEKLPKSLVAYINQCLSSCHNFILLGLESYRNQMPTSLPNSVIETLKRLLEYASTVCEIHGKCLKLDSFTNTKIGNLVETVTNSTAGLSIKVQGIIDEINSAKEKDELDTKKTKKPKTRKPLKSNAFQARLSMYSISHVARPNAAWKKTVQAVVKDKYHYVQSRYKTAGFKHRPPIEKPDVVDITNTMNLFSKRSSSITKTASPAKTIRDDENDIETMMAIENEIKVNKDDHVNVDSQFSKSTDDGHTQQLPENTNVQLLVKALIQQLYAQSYSKNGEDMTQEHWENFVKDIMGMGLDGKINKNNLETGSKKNGHTNHQNGTTDVIQALEKYLEDKFPTLIENFLKSNINHKQNGVTNHSVGIQVNNFVKPENGEKWGRNGDTNVIIINKPDERDMNDNYNYELTQNHYKKVTDTISKNENQTENNQKRHRPPKKPLKISEIGEKNAKLIWISNENSITENSTDLITTDDIRRFNSHYNKGISSEMQVNIVHKNAKEVHQSEKARALLKLHQFPKRTLPKLTKIFSQQQVARLSEHRIKFLDYLRRDRIYNINIRPRPWFIVDNIVEKITDDLMECLTGEIHLNYILENLIKAEFQ